MLVIHREPISHKNRLVGLHLQSSGVLLRICERISLQMLIIRFICCRMFSFPCRQIPKKKSYFLPQSANE